MDSSPAIYVFIIISVVTTALCMIVAAAVVFYLRKLRRQTLSRNEKCLKATNRYIYATWATSPHPSSYVVFVIKVW